MLDFFVKEVHIMSKFKNNNLLVFISLLLIFPVVSNAFEITEYFPDFPEKSKIYQDISLKGKKEDFGNTGRIEELNQLLLSAVKPENKTASDYFILGNMLFGGYLDQSIEFMKIAEKLSKNNPLIMYERAIQEHRNNNCEGAVGYYDRFFETSFGKNHAIARARSTECYLKTKRYSDAIDSWILADHGSNHISIEKAIFSMYEGEPYYSRRLKLLNKIIKDNETNLFPELISLDLEWRIDWWNIEVNQQYLDLDLALAKKMLVDTEYEKLKVLTHLVKKDLTKDEVVKLLDETELWNKTSQLPKSDIFMYHLVFYLSKQGLVTPTELLNRFEDELRQRVFSESKRTKNLDILAYIYSETDQAKLKEIDLLGWKKYGVSNYALSLFMSETDAKKKLNILDQIALDFPYEPQIAEAKFAFNKNKSIETDLMANMVVGEFLNVKNVYNSYKLKDYIYSLAKQINHKVYSDTLKD